MTSLRTTVLAGDDYQCLSFFPNHYRAFVTKSFLRSKYSIKDWPRNSPTGAG